MAYLLLIACVIATGIFRELRDDASRDRRPLRHAIYGAVYTFLLPACFVAMVYAAANWVLWNVVDDPSGLARLHSLETRLGDFLDTVEALQVPVAWLLALFVAWLAMQAWVEAGNADRAAGRSGLPAWIADRFVRAVTRYSKLWTSAWIAVAFATSFTFFSASLDSPHRALVLRIADQQAFAANAADAMNKAVAEAAVAAALDEMPDVLQQIIDDQDSVNRHLAIIRQLVESRPAMPRAESSVGRPYSVPETRSSTRGPERSAGPVLDVDRRTAAEILNGRAELERYLRQPAGHGSHRLLDGKKFAQELVSAALRTRYDAVVQQLFGERIELRLLAELLWSVIDAAQSKVTEPVLAGALNSATRESATVLRSLRAAAERLVDRSAYRAEWQALVERHREGLEAERVAASRRLQAVVDYEASLRSRIAAAERARSARLEAIRQKLDRSLQGLAERFPTEERLIERYRLRSTAPGLPTPRTPTTWDLERRIAELATERIVRDLSPGSMWRPVTLSTPPGDLLDRLAPRSYTRESVRAFVSRLRKKLAELPLEVQERYVASIERATESGGAADSVVRALGEAVVELGVAAPRETSGHELLEERAEARLEQRLRRAEYWARQREQARRYRPYRARR